MGFLCMETYSLHATFHSNKINCFYKHTYPRASCNKTSQFGIQAGQHAAIKEQQKARGDKIEMIVQNNGAHYLARSSVQWAKKQGLPRGVKWNRTVWGTESQIDMTE